MSPNSRHRDGRQGKTTRKARMAASRLQRVLRRTATSGQQAYATLLAVLAQHGGEVTITQGTIDQVTQNYARLGWRVEKRGEGKEFVVCLVQAEEANPTDTATSGPDTTEPETVITHIAADAAGTGDTEMSAQG